MIGMFAGRGDVVLAMALALLVGFWAGWRVHQLVEYLKRRK